ncbi:hypothetical protein F2Q69_00053154 [Brassica cretica]|uniref:Uncharacterized protein n=1 Tax=Brassica cretica TaxID=69181 RepID=A0A8S9MU38_BRACR|nr:hypothetical protein F2Q69_00053154 [Brassica cretica]
MIKTSNKIHSVSSVGDAINRNQTTSAHKDSGFQKLIQPYKSKINKSTIPLPNFSSRREDLTEGPNSSLLVKECGRDAEGTSLPLVGSSSAFVSSSSVPSSFLGSSLSFAVPSLPLSMEPCHSELSLLIGMPSDGKVAREQLSLLVHKMELADGRKSWSEIAESVIAVELGTLTRSEAEDRVSASLIEEGTGFLFDEHGTNLAVEPGVEGSRLSLTTPLIVPSSSSLVKKTMLETVRKYEQMRLANSSQTKESSSETTSSSDDSSYSSSHSEKSVDSADVAGEYDNISEDDKRDDDIENVDVEDDGALESAYDEWNGTCDVNFGEESDQDEYASDGDHAAVGDDEMGDRDGVDGRSDFSGECDDFSDEQDSFSGEQSGVSGSLGAIVVDDGRDDTDGGSDRRADKKKRVRKARERPRSSKVLLLIIGIHWSRFLLFVDEDTIKWISANCCCNGVIEARIPGEDDRPWTVPEGWLCVYDFWFTEYHLWFPLPRLLLAYCDEHLIALTQLTPAAIRNIVAAADIGVHMSLCLFERIAHITRCDKTDGAFYVSMKAGCGVVGERKRKTLCWIKKFFYVRIAPSSVPDATKFANKLVVNQDEELEEVKAELEKTKAELASIKDKADGSEEIAALHGKYEAEKKVSSDALEEVEKLTAKIALEAGRVKKRQAADLERFKKEKEVAGRRYRRAVTRHDDVLATFNSRIEKVRRYVENQKVVRIAMHGVNQIMGVLDAAKTWKKEAIIIPDGKVKHLENELVQRKEMANLVVRVEFEPKELADIPSFDFTRPLSPAHPSLTAGVEDAAKARGKEENRRREEASRRRVADRAGAVSSSVRREGQVPSRP